MGCMASSLMHIHKHKVGHNVTKPQNILLFPNRVIKFTDFGISRDRDGHDNTTTHTSYGPSRGYAAPEFRGTAAETEKAGFNQYESDVYSIGCAFRHIATVRYILFGRHYPRIEDITWLLDNNGYKKGGKDITDYLS